MSSELLLNTYRPGSCLLDVTLIRWRNLSSVGREIKDIF